MRKFVLLLPLCLRAQVSVEVKRLSEAPVLQPGPAWTSTGIFNPTAMEFRGKTVLLFRATDARMISRIGYAESHDGIHFQIRSEPVLSPSEPYEAGGGVEDPRVVSIGGLFYMTYTGYNGHDAQLCLATSRDLLHWDRRGVILPAYKGTWNVKWTKSGAILPEKIQGRWWMYYLGTRLDPDGKERDYMGLASSRNLLEWADATVEPVMPRRAGAFDSRVMEPGPSPILTGKGILLLYNGASDALVYGPGWALFDRNDPGKLLARSDKPFLAPEREWEKKGVVPNVVFLEGMLPQGKLNVKAYYGAADRATGAVRLRIRLVK